MTIDLRGHTLRGPGSGVAVDAYDYPNSPRVSVSDGRLERWDVGVTGLSTVRSVRLVDNRVGIQCWEDCVSARNVFARNDVGFANFGESGAVIKHSAFKRNRIGVEARNLGSTRILASRFVRNRTGVVIRFTMTAVPIGRSTFVKNRVAVRVEPGDTEGTCADLDRNRYVRNGRTLVGPAC